MTKTEELYEKALHDPDLAPKGGCKYVDANGKRCIVATMLHILGVPDEVLRGKRLYPNDHDPNDVTLSIREDLQQGATEFGLDVGRMLYYQSDWDRG